MNETVETFGRDGHLVGTLTLPGERTTPGVVVVLLNAGVIHRIGPHRINVKVARHLARLGLASLRVDLSGQGDSRTARDAAPFAQEAIADIGSAMDHVERTLGVHRFVVAGFCSGAKHGFAVAQVDDRVIGVWMMDGLAYSTRRSRLRQWRGQIEGFRLRTAPSRLVRRARRVATGVVRVFRRLGVAPEPGADGGGDTPTRDEFASGLQRLVDRGVSVSVVYSGSLIGEYNYPGQFHDAFADQAFVSKVRCDFVPDVDHVMTTLAAQRQIIQLVGDCAARISALTSGCPSAKHGEPG